MLNLKFALRTLFRTPFVTVVAIISLALGIGATAAIFSLFNQILLRPLPVNHPEQLVNLSAPGPMAGSNSCNQAGPCTEVFSYPMFRDLERQQTSFTAIAAHRLFAANLSARGTTLSTQGVFVSGSYFPVLGIQPALGRLLGPEDDRVSGDGRVAVLSYDYWQTRFGSDPKVLNDSVIINGQPMTIVGVAPRGFEGTTLGSRPQVFVPLTMSVLQFPADRDQGLKRMDNRRNYWLYLFARLKPGVSIARASAAINVPFHAILNDVEAPLQKGMSDQTLAKFKAKRLLLAPGQHGQTSVSSDARGPLTLLLGVTILVLLIACANIANLLLARSAARVVSVQGYQAGPDTDMNSRYNEIGPGYFQTLGIPLLAGRDFTRADGATADEKPAGTSPKVAIVNETFAKKFNLWPNPVGKHLGQRDKTPDTLIVGLVKDAKYSDVKDKIPPVFFRPYTQDDHLGFMSFFVRTKTDPDTFMATIRKTVAQLDPNLPIENLITMPDQVKENVFLDRFISVLSAAFALLATLLAAVGLYGVLAYTVAQRTKEIGLRMALGADAARVRGMVLRQVGKMTLIGGAVGLVAAIGLARLAKSLLFELQATDPGVLALSLLILALVAMGAGLIPAHRAAQVDPMHALRYE